MITGTFNIIVAQRLGRKLRDEYKVQIDVRKDYGDFYISARQSLLTMKQDALEKELQLRGIGKQQVVDFIERGVAFGPDPAKGPDAFKGRVGIYEMLEFDDEIKQMLLDGEKALAVEKYALQEK
ncbi:MAG: hypothetical protein Q8O99_07090 [bacterium]|nr:hypothetical protein [bacterium]